MSNVKFILFGITMMSAGQEGLPKRNFPQMKVLSANQPYDLKLNLIAWTPPTVRLTWKLDTETSPEQNPCDVGIKKFEVSIRPTNDKYRLVLDVSSQSRSVILDRLRSGAEYELYLSSVSERGLHNGSKIVRFVAPHSDNDSVGPTQSEVPSPPTITVREEEVIIVAIVLAVWVAVILLFFNKWGKIRMLEPYQPQYQSESFSTSLPKTSRVSVSDPLASGFLEREMARFSPIPSYNAQRCNRLRQNSVFVGSAYRTSSICPDETTPRKAKSAEDIKSLVVQITHCDVETSAL